MPTARQPEIVYIPQGMKPDEVHDLVSRTGCEITSAPKPGLLVVYPDSRLLPRKCSRTKMIRVFCPCAPCRALRRRKHRASCSCYFCFADRIGKFIDDLGKRTEARRWLWFLTLTFRTRHFPWARHFPIEQAEPHAHFVHRYFSKMIRWVESEVHHPVEYFKADQFGELGGRIHLHCGLSWPGLFEYRWKDLQKKLWREAGFNRIFPWEKDAGYYIGRYVGRDAQRATWDWRVGNSATPTPVLNSIGRELVAVSLVPDESSRAYRRTLGAWHR